MSDIPEGTPHDDHIPDEEQVRKLEAELIPQVIEDERRRGEEIIRSCLSEAERAILDGDDSIFGYPSIGDLDP